MRLKSYSSYKKLICTVAFLLFISVAAEAQNEFLNSTNFIAPSIRSPAILKPNFTAPSRFNPNNPSTNSPSKSILETNPMQFSNSNNFKNPGDVFKEKLNKFEGEDESKVFRKNQYLGDFKTKSATITLSYRDFGEIDGDEIRILVNDKVIKALIFLDGSFHGFELGLEKGFNKIEFEALNQGTSGPNTAEFAIYDEKGVQISANRWSLATGFKASIIVVRE